MVYIQCAGARLVMSWCLFFVYLRDLGTFVHCAFELELSDVLCVLLGSCVVTRFWSSIQFSCVSASWSGSFQPLDKCNTNN
eukprot:m.478159 g.478159  ORF g.478159 m.478159 type:complete len:81 (+) comp45719_c0_seq1:223-465(+)